MRTLTQYPDLSHAPELSRGIFLTIGNFDGVHKGHQELLSRIVRAAGKEGGVPTVLTFDPHPLMVLSPETPFRRLMSVAHKKSVLESLGIQLLVIEPFSDTLSRMSPDTFIRDVILAHFSPKALFIGADFRFGYRRGGSVADFHRILEPSGVHVESVEAVSDALGRISSSRIRTLVAEGRVLDAMSLLTRPYRLEGMVVVGDRRGKALGFPTLNLEPAPDRLVPPPGIYATRTQTPQGLFDGVSYVGTKPTFDPLPKPIVETFLFDFDRDIYGAPISVDFYEHIRGEAKFSGPDELVQAITNDVRQAKDFFHGRRGTLPV